MSLAVFNLTTGARARAAEAYEAARSKMATPFEALDDALAVLSGARPKARPTGVPPEIDALIRAIAEAQGFTVSQIRGNGRGRSAAKVRAEAVYVARLLSGVSFPELGRYFGGRHHTTIWWAHQEFEKRLAGDELLRARVEKAYGRTTAAAVAA